MKKLTLEDIHKDMVNNNEMDSYTKSLFFDNSDNALYDEMFSRLLKQVTSIEKRLQDENIGKTEEKRLKRLLTNVTVQFKTADHHADTLHALNGYLANTLEIADHLRAEELHFSHHLFVQFISNRSALTYDKFTGRVLFNGRILTDEDALRVQSALTFIRTFKHHTVTKSAVLNYMTLEAHRNTSDSIINHLDTLLADDSIQAPEDVREAFLTLFDVKINKNTLNIASACLNHIKSRAYMTDIQTDLNLVLVGREGSRKSSAVKSLAIGEYSEVTYTRDENKLRDMVSRCFIVEDPEATLKKKMGHNEFKALISQRMFEIDVKYKVQTDIRPNRSFIISTTNDSSVVRGFTGERRTVVLEQEHAVNPLDMKGMRELADSILKGVAEYHAQGKEFEFESSALNKNHKQYSANGMLHEALDTLINRLETKGDDSMINVTDTHVTVAVKWFHGMAGQYLCSDFGTTAKQLTAFIRNLPHVKRSTIRNGKQQLSAYKIPLPAEHDKESS